MSPAISKHLGAAVLTSFLLVALDAQCQMAGLNARAVEIAQLPKFCWEQMGVPDAKGPEYGFPRACGGWLTHYCPGLVKIIRAKSPATKEKATLLREAKKDIRYTNGAIKDLPSCPIRGQVEATLAEVENLLKIYGANRSLSK